MIKVVKYDKSYKVAKCHQKRCKTKDNREPNMIKVIKYDKS